MPRILPGLVRSLLCLQRTSGVWYWGDVNVSRGLPEPLWVLPEVRTAHLASPFLITYVRSGARACLACLVWTAAAHACWPHTGMSDAVVTHCPQQTLRPVLEAPNKDDSLGSATFSLEPCGKHWAVLMLRQRWDYTRHTHTEERKKQNCVTFKQFRKTVQGETASGQGVRDEPESPP